jgi:disulfide bond formation protein DsbB
MTRLRVSQTILVVMAAGGSAAMLAAAFGFQHLGGLPPCEMCLWQRWPHLVAVIVGILALAVPQRVSGARTSRIALICMGGLAAATTAGLGAFHGGVEQGWWDGVTTCSTNADISGLSTTDLLSQIMAAPVVRCDEIPWQMLGLSMAGWNAVASAGLVILWIKAAQQKG